MALTSPVRQPNARRTVGLSTLALAAAFGALALAQPALAQKAPAPGVQVVTKQMAGPLNDATKALAANDFATAKAKIDAAAGFAKTPTDNITIAKLRFRLAELSKDNPGRVQAIEAIIATGLLTPDELKQYKAALPPAYLAAGDQAKAIALTRAYIDEYGGTAQQYAGIGSDALKAKDYATAETYLTKSIETGSANGAKAPENYYLLLMKTHREANAMAKYYEVEEKLLAVYPKDAYWRELSARAQSEPGFKSDEGRLDLYRVWMGAKTTMKPEEQVDMAVSANRRVLPAEALAILQPLFDSGAVGGASDAQATPRRNLLTEVTNKAKVEKAGLAAEEKSLLAKGKGEDLAALGEVYMTHGDNAKAAELMSKGLEKGIADAGKAAYARLHLGIAQYRAGQKDAAKATWAQVTGDNGAAIFARNWKLIADLVP